MTALDAAGTEPGGAINGVIGSRVTAFRTKMVTVTIAGAQGGTIRIQIGAVSSLGGVGAINRPTAAHLLLWPTSPRTAP